MTATTVLVLGANGRFGAAAVQAFAAAGWRVLAQARRTPTTPLPPGAVAIDTALGDTEALARRAAGARVVVYAVNPVYTRWDAELLPLARQGMAVAERLGARFMLPGNAYNFGAGMPARLLEDTPQRPTTSKGRQRCQVEDELQARAAQGLASASSVRGTSMAPAAVRGSIWPSSRTCGTASWSIPARSMCRMPGPTCPTWRAPSSRSPRATTRPVPAPALCRPHADGA